MFKNNLNHLKNKNLKLALSTAIILFILFSFRFILIGYPYYIDENFSITSSDNSWETLFNSFIFPDTHPPLYPSLLKIWIDIFGNSEIPTRILSFIPSLFTLLFFAREALLSKINNRFFTFLIIIINPLFFYYSQQVRNYSLMIFFASITTVLFLNLKFNSKSKNNNQIMYYVSLYLLSLTHYFGLIYSLILEFFKNFEKPLIINKKKLFFTFGTLLFWPLIHKFLGMNLDRIEWIGELDTFKPFLTNIGCFIRVLFPWMPPILNFMRGDIILISIILTSFAFIFLNTKIKIINNYDDKLKNIDLISQEILLLTKICFTFLLILCFIDLIKPISTIRNYTVLLPLVSIIIGNSFYLFQKNNYKSFLNKIFLYSFLIFLIILNMNTSHKLISEKIQTVNESSQFSRIFFDDYNIKFSKNKYS